MYPPFSRYLPTIYHLLVFAAILGSFAVVAVDLVDEHSEFADSLTSDLYGDNENECTSSLGVSMAFDLIYPSAIGATRQDMQDVFGFPDQNGALQWAKTASELTGTYTGECYEQSSPTECTSEAPFVSIANSVWVPQDLTLNTTYAAVVGPLARTLDFAAENAGSIINSWAANNTNGLIDSMVDDGPLDPSWILVVMNALYLKASWRFPFAESDTNEDTFYTSALRTTEQESKTHFMHIVQEFLYSHTAVPGYQVLKLNFNGQSKSSGLSMIFVLPTSDSGDVVSSVDVLDALPKLETTRVAVALPKFKFESEYSKALMASLQAIGLVAPFSGGLCVRQGSCAAFVDLVIQKTVIDVNEKGVEAAAVTLIALGESAPGEPPAPPVLFLCDHPFQFFIYDENENVVLFEGEVGNPGLPEGSLGATLKDKHSDASFWESNFDVEPILVEITTTTTTNTTTTNTTDSLDNVTDPGESSLDSNETSVDDDASAAFRQKSLSLSTLAIAALLFAVFAY